MYTRIIFPQKGTVLFIIMTHLVNKIKDARLKQNAGVSS